LRPPAIPLGPEQVAVSDDLMDSLLGVGTSGGGGGGGEHSMPEFTGCTEEGSVTAPAGGGRCKVLWSFSADV
jgi:hypothetical protein